MTGKTKRPGTLTRHPFGRLSWAGFKRPRRRLITRRSVFWGTAALVGVASAGIPLTGWMPTRLLYNQSDSAPPGWYRLAPLEVISRGDLVVSNLPHAALELAVERRYLAPGVPVIKTVRALAGDTVCEAEGVLYIDGTPTVRLLSADSLGRSLPSPWGSCRQLQTDEVLLLSDRTPDSFDGRYFGPVRESDIIGRAVWLGKDEKPPAKDGYEEIGGRSECKIKAHGANEGASPCLHIDFYGSMLWDVAPSSEQALNKHNRIGWLYSGALACFPPEQPE